MRHITSSTSRPHRSQARRVFLFALAILVGGILLFARLKSKDAQIAVAPLSKAGNGTSSYRNRSLLKSLPSSDRPEAQRPTITGNVYGNDGAPIPGATVVATTFELAGNIPSTAGSVQSDETGRFELPLPEGTYQLKANREGYGPTATTAHTGTMVSLIMPKSGVVTGHVYDEKKAPVRRFTIDVISSVSADMPAPPPLWSRSFDSPDGSFQVDQLPDWGVLIRATAADSTPAISEELDVGPGQTTNVDLTLTKGCVLTGKVEDKAGAPVPRVVVDAEALVAEGSASELSVQTAEQVETELDGTFRLDHVPTGKVVVRAYDGSSAVTTLSLKVSDCSALAPVKLVLTSGGSVAGVARQANGAPLALARLSLVSRSIGFVNTTSDAEGRFRFDDLPPGAMMLELRHEGRATQLSASVNEGEVTSQDITLQRDGDAELRGRVTANGKPLAGIQLMIGAFRGEAEGVSIYNAVTDTDGDYRVPSIQEGNYVVSILSAAQGRTVVVPAVGVATANIDIAKTTASNDQQ